MIEYTWEVTDLLKKNEWIRQEIVTSIEWRLTATDGIRATSISGVQGLIPHEINPNFVEFYNITDQILIMWLQESMGESAVNAHKRILANRIIQTL